MNEDWKQPPFLRYDFELTTVKSEAPEHLSIERAQQIRREFKEGAAHVPFLHHNQFFFDTVFDRDMAVHCIHWARGKDTDVVCFLDENDTAYSINGVVTPPPSFISNSSSMEWAAVREAYAEFMKATAGHAELADKIRDLIQVASLKEL